MQNGSKDIRIGLYFWWSATFIVIGSSLIFIGWLLSSSYNNMFWRGLDALFTQMALSLREDSLTWLMKAVSSWGLYGSLGIWLSLMAGLWWRKYYWNLGLAVSLSGGGWLFSELWKLVIARTRPMGINLVQEFSYSFPSQHAFTSVILYLSLVYFCYHFSRKFWLSLTAFIFALVIIFLISFSRIYLGVHHFSDIIGGFVIGLGYFLMVVHGIKLARFFFRKF